MEKIISIIIPTYNMEKYLHKCLDSLMVSESNMNRLEVLVINDGSKDSSSQIAHEYESRFPATYRVIDKQNGNYGSCINRGLKEATGRYIKVLDADDYFVNQVFDKFIDYLAQNDVDLVFNEYCIVDVEDNIQEKFTFDLPTNRSFSLNEIPQGMEQWLWHQGITYKTKLLQSMAYKQTEGISYTDDEWTFEPMSNVKSIVYFPHIMYHYLLGREGQTFDPKVLQNSFDKRIIVGKSMVMFYASVINRCSNDARHYMDEKIIQRLSVIYNFYLIKHYTLDGKEKLMEMDQFIQNCSPEIYALFNRKKNRFGGDSYITAWRNANYKLILQIKIRQIKFKLHLLLGKEYRNLHMPDNLRKK